MNPSSVRWSELTQGGMRSASQMRHLFSSGASRLPCARSASRNSGSPITLLFLSCLNCVLCAEAQRPARISANLEEAAARREYLPPGDRRFQAYQIESAPLSRISLTPLHSKAQRASIGPI